ncbi:MAG: class I SAM-dependent methyltransferase [Campylobacterales bacterium]|nr:class I SAM-dependent methyltransferase [Campylobacterales bacterium]
MNCPVCTAQTLHFFDPLMEWDFYRCPTCKLIFKDPKHAPSAAKELQIYNNHHNTIDSPGYAPMFEEFIDFSFRADLNSIHEVLDFGCGPGPVLAVLMKRLGLHVSLYDKYFHPHPCYEGKVFDLITCTEVIEHVADPLGLLRFFHQHLHKGGYLALMTQFHPNDETHFLQWWYRKDPTHVTFFRPETFAYMAAHSGFKVLRFDPKKSIYLQKSAP